MKELIISLSLLASAAVGYSQGVINWTDVQTASSGSPGEPALPAFSITVFGNGTLTPGAGSYPYNASIDEPPGNAIWTGQPLSGSADEIGLYVDTTQSAVNNDTFNRTPVATTSFLTGADAGTWSLSASLFAEVPFLPSGTPVYVELAAWSTAEGATTFAQALGQGVPLTVSGVSSGTTTLGGGGSPPV